MPQGLPSEFAGLLLPAAYPHGVSDIRLIETHLSWVLLTGPFAYKIPRPVRYDFVDLTDAARRDALCEEGLRLNRRFAPRLYLDVCDIVRRDGGAKIGGPGDVIGRALRMVQFPVGQVLDPLLDAGPPEPSIFESFGRELADLHAGLPVAGPTDPFADPLRPVETIRANLKQTQAVLPTQAARVKALAETVDARLSALQKVLEARAASGRIRECHGDLHAGNVVLLQGRLQPFDCLDFDASFRWIDVADEVAFLHVDLAARGCVPQANAFLNGYLARGGDYGACRVLDVYRAHRALVRAKVEGLSQAPLARIERWLAAAEDALSRRRPRMLLLHGLSGSGKTWLARRLAPQLDAIHIRSDVERKRLAGLDETASSGSMAGEGLYSSARSVAVFDRLADCAADVLEAGRTVIVDATFLRREVRQRFVRLAGRYGADLRLLSVQAPDSLLRERLAARAAAGRDASEADAAVLDWQRGQVEAPLPEEGFGILQVDSAALEDAGSLAALCGDLSLLSPR